MSMVAVLSIRHHLHVGDDTVRLDKAVAGSQTSGRPSPLSVIAPECSGKARRPADSVRVLIALDKPSTAHRTFSSGSCSRTAATRPAPGPAAFCCEHRSLGGNPAICPAGRCGVIVRQADAERGSTWPVKVAALTAGSRGPALPGTSGAAWNHPTGRAEVRRFFTSLRVRGDLAVGRFRTGVLPGCVAGAIPSDAAVSPSDASGGLSPCCRTR
jgi:hypothetical protein